MFEYGKTHALRVLDEAESFIKKNLCALSEDDLCGVETFVAEYLWMRETYSRLLAIWPGRKYRRNERTVLLQRFRELVPDLSFTASLERESGDCCSLNQRDWIVCDAYDTEPEDFLVMGYTDYIDVGWPCVNDDGIISPEAIIILDNLSEYMLSGKRLYRLGELIAKEQIRRERNKYLCDVLSYALEHKEEILADDSLYMMKIPTCESGSSISGKLLFPIGALLESWEKCPDFHLDDGSNVVSFGGGLSGLCIGESVNLQTGEVIGHKGMTRNGKTITWQFLVAITAPFRARAKRLFNAGVIPKDFSQIIPIPGEVKTYRNQTYIRRKKRH